MLESQISDKSSKPTEVFELSEIKKEIQDLKMSF